MDLSSGIVGDFGSKPITIGITQEQSCAPSQLPLFCRNPCWAGTLYTGITQGRSVAFVSQSAKYRPRTIVNHVVPGRWDEVRPPSEAEIRATMVLSLPLNEVSAKVRTGQPIDDEEDYSLASWAGVLPLSLDAHAPVPDPQLPAGIHTPSYVRFYRRGLPAGIQPK